jgi:type I restriction enzyme S subunit
MGYADIFDITLYKDYVLDDCDILMSHINSREFLGRTVLYRKENDETIIHGMNVLRIKTNPELLDAQYANYLFQTSYFKKLIDSIRKDAINQSSIAISDICGLELDIPTIKEQRQIAAVLSTLDDKIALNRQINDNLPTLDHSLAVAAIRLAA